LNPICLIFDGIEVRLYRVSNRLLANVRSLIAEQIDRIISDQFESRFKIAGVHGSLVYAHKFSWQHQRSSRNAKGAMLCLAPTKQIPSVR
jgi:hypothetical protein